MKVKKTEAEKFMERCQAMEDTGLSELSETELMDRAIALGLPSTEVSELTDKQVYELVRIIREFEDRNPGSTGVITIQ